MRGSIKRVRAFIQGTVIPAMEQLKDDERDGRVQELVDHCGDLGCGVAWFAQVYPLVAQTEDDTFDKAPMCRKRDKVGATARQLGDGLFEILLIRGLYRSTAFTL
ncbi:hypothetical protein AB0F17_51965 [Nonomuraea sp. NPDC026600]|uniref:hypothetical protein n=1 Tax=Nonomuraea sp. NPDC026600 TaxID=3155363 RepID=UPI0033C4E676